jgi:chemotaxis protein methyltransferase CheR
MKRIREARQSTSGFPSGAPAARRARRAYSLAMAFAEDRQRWEGWRIDILRTDVSGSAIARAREGLYTQFEVQRGLSVFQMMRWFVEEGAQQWARLSSAPLLGLVREPPLTGAAHARASFDLSVQERAHYYSPRLSRGAFSTARPEASPPHRPA